MPNFWQVYSRIFHSSTAWNIFQAIFFSRAVLFPCLKRVFFRLSQKNSITFYHTFPCHYELVPQSFPDPQGTPCFWSNEPHYLAFRGKGNVQIGVRTEVRKTGVRNDNSALLSGGAHSMIFSVP